MRLSQQKKSRSSETINWNQYWISKSKANNDNEFVSQSKFRQHCIRQLLSEGWCKLVKISTKAQIADIATKILTTDTVKYFSNIVLGTVDQSLYVYDPYHDIPFNDWGVVSVPDLLFQLMYGKNVPMYIKPVIIAKVR